jgi:hypothetical protein
MSEDVKPEPIKRDKKFARAVFAIAVTVLVGVSTFELLHWLAHLRH